MAFKYGLPQETIGEINSRLYEGAKQTFADYKDPFGKPPFEDIEPTELEDEILALSLLLPNQYCKFFRVGATLGHCAALRCVDNLPKSEQADARVYFEEIAYKSLHGIRHGNTPAFYIPKLIYTAGNERGRQLTNDCGYGPLQVQDDVYRFATDSFGYVMDIVHMTLIERAMYMYGDENITVEMLEELGETADAISKMTPEMFRQVWYSEVDMY